MKGARSLPDSSSASSDRKDPIIHAPLEGFSHYRGENWSPERLAFHQNLEQFADRVGLIVGLQGNGKISQEMAYDQIRQLWSSLRDSRSTLLE